MIPCFDYRPAYARIKEEVGEALRRVLDSGRVILGREVRAFEEEFADWAGIDHAVGVASGTDALILALRAIGVGAGDEVITVANAGVPPIVAIRSLGAMPRLVDVRRDTLLMDPDRLKAALGERTRCVLPVHLYGQPADLRSILKFAEAHDLPVIEDCAQAHGATYDGRHVGGFGTLGCFSFYPTKNLGAFGDGGLCVTRDDEIARRLRSLRMYGFEGDGHAHIEGMNSRLDELQAAILRVKLQHLDADVAERRAIAGRYLERLADSAYGVPGRTPGSTHAYHLFVIRTEERDGLRERLDASGIGTGIHYPEPVHRMEAYDFLARAAGDLPASEEACRTVLSLPIYPGLTPSAVDQVVEALHGSAASEPDAGG